MEKRWRHLFDDGPFTGNRSTGNRLELFCDGDASFEAVWEAIESAKTRVWIEIYTLEPDAVGNRTLRLLTKAAGRGCDVILVCDRFGSSHLLDDHRKPLEAAGGRVVMFNPPWPWRKIGHQVGSLLHRDHRKVVVVDDDIGFCGGRNISEAYAGKEYGTNFYYDTLMRIKGSATRRLASVFLSSLSETAGIERPLPPLTPGEPDGVPVQVLGLNDRKDKHLLNKAIQRVLAAAREKCYLTTPYFVPAGWFMQGLIDAARRGVDVRVMTAGDTDVPAARIAGRHIYGRLLKEGIRIYELTGQTLHAKNFTVDGGLVSVGSYNIDRWSSQHNLEANVAAISPELAERLEAEFFMNARRAREVSLGEWRRRPFYRQALQFTFYHLAML